MSKEINEIEELKEFCTPLEVDPEVVDKINKLGSSPQHSPEEVAAIFGKTYERLKEYNEGNDGYWVILQEFPDYSISKSGLIKNNKTGRIKYPSIGAKGYPVVSLQKDGKQYLRTIHILLGRTFIYNDNPQEKTQINHIDGNKENFNLSNLEWVTPQENVIHARKTGLHTSDGDKAVIQLSKDGKIIAEYKSASEASRQTGINRGNICKVSNHYISKEGKRSLTAGGYKWEWKSNMIW